MFPILALGAALLLTSCAKKTTVAKAPPATVPAPVASITASPSSIQQGQSTTLTWQTSNANEITIEGLGTVAASGTRRVSPSITTNYALTAKGPGGTGNANASVTVTAATAAAVPSHIPSDDELFRQAVKDVFFDFDRSTIRSTDKPAAEGDAAFLAKHPNLRVVVEGHCDDRGSEEYNLALGESRARALRDNLVAQGVSPDRIKTISYGKEQPFCSQDDEACWQQNRRDHFALQH
ncbi:MAG TPA: peptidoglycan-associated lipoprotein Pal [Candidatus Angelobacter sp.]|nr:peptidoglycan-associated lipoprotein Pal [Candidatus Angelobacter sp.]